MIPYSRPSHYSRTRDSSSSRYYRFSSRNHQILGIPDQICCWVNTRSIRTADAGSSRCSGLVRAWTDVRRCMPQSRSFWLILVVNRQVIVELLSCRADNALWRLVAEATYHRAWTFVSACRCRAVKGIAVEWAKERSSREFPQETHDRLPLVGQAQHLQQVRLVSTDDRTIATSPRDKWRLLPTFVSTMRCRSR